MSIENSFRIHPGLRERHQAEFEFVLRQTELTPSSFGERPCLRDRIAEYSVLNAISADSREHISEQAADAARTAAAIMSMNNVYYRFLHLTDNEKYKQIPARLRMQGIRTHGIDQADFELWCTAVSAIGNCKTCVASHEQVLREKGISEEQVAAAYVLLRRSMPLPLSWMLRLRVLSI